jgi:hypothetical protein
MLDATEPLSLVHHAGAQAITILIAVGASVSIQASIALYRESDP